MKLLNYLQGRDKSKPIVKPIVCSDGFKISVQASSGHYCTPRADDVDWLKVECGYPSDKPEFISEYAEDSSRLTDTVYPYTPIGLVEQLIASHGGISE